MAKGLICARCGQRGKTETETRGSDLIEIILWLTFLVPGLIYSMWRLRSRREICSVCGANALVPVTTPLGRVLLAKYYPGELPPGHDDDLPAGNALRGYVYLVLLAAIVIWIIYSVA